MGRASVSTSMALRPWLLALALIATASRSARADIALRPPATSEPSGAKVVVLGSGLRYVDLRLGTGPELGAKATITVHYVGTLPNGTEIDSTRRRGEPAKFHLGSGQLIKGWELGVPGMRVGGIRRLIIPPSLAYGDRATGGIPAKSQLSFDVELIAIEPSG